ncbi:MAG: flagellar hook-associated protein FlgK [Betaproteobacteria bacterium HGW-Betaproteobacteria-12]|nr:MAG: flagellar hook-associated protein FlgK [Betaproteobacteria bacterium HGW-Betaproteobacteria-12]
MMSSGIFGIGVSGIAAAQLGLLATEHNVVNANTPGYTRQRTLQATNIAVNTGAGSIGQGVHVQTITRMYDAFITKQVDTAQTKVSQLDAFYSQIKQIDNMLADSDAGISPALQDFFSGVQQVASNPSLLPARQAMVSSAQTLVERFRSMDARLVEINGEVNGRISDAVTQVNTYAGLIAEVNQQIVVSQASYNQPPNDLLDQRDSLISDLNRLIKVSTTTNSDGSSNVFIGSGQQLVIGGTAQQMTATPSVADPTRIVVGLQTPGGPLELPESLVVGGELGGLVAFRAASLDRVANEVGRMAASLTLTFNAQLGLGQDLQGRIAGETGFVGSLFTMSAPQVLDNAFNTGAGVLSAAFAPPTAPTPPDFSGNFSTELSASNYQISFGAAGAYTVTRLTDNQTVGSGSGPGVANFDGINLTISTVGNDGDKFKIEPYAQVARNIGVDARIAADPRLIAAAAPVRVTPDVANTGSLQISQGIVGTGYTAPAAPVALTATPTLLQGVPGAWTAVYSDGSSVPGAGDIPLTSGAATLAGFTFNNMHFTVAGTPPAAGSDSFVVERNAAGVQDGRNAVLFAKLQTQNTVDGGTSTYQGVYAKLVADNGIRTREAKVQLDAQTSVLQQAEATREALSGVNLDEEAANMLKFQRAYQASSKILEIGNKLFDTILSLG